MLCGLPKPVECRLPDHEGGVGSTRECISDKGTIQQRITEWEPGYKLSFQLEKTDLYFGPCVESIVEQFELAETDQGGCQVTRTTTFKTRGPFAPIVSVPVFIGLKSIHRYVFRNWKRLSE